MVAGCTKHTRHYTPVRQLPVMVAERAPQSRASRPSAKALLPAGSVEEGPTLCPHGPVLPARVAWPHRPHDRARYVGVLRCAAHRPARRLLSSYPLAGASRSVLRATAQAGRAKADRSRPEPLHCGDVVACQRQLARWVGVDRAIAALAPQASSDHDSAGGAVIRAQASRASMSRPLSGASQDSPVRDRRACQWRDYRQRSIPRP